MPKDLITPSQLEELRLQWKPSFVPLNQETNATKAFDNETGITQRRLSNGIPVNYKVILVLVHLMDMSCVCMVIFYQIHIHPICSAWLTSLFIYFVLLHYR